MATLRPMLLRGTRRELKVASGAKRPVIAGHKLLYKCNLECDMCPFWRRPDEKLLGVDDEVEIMESLVRAGVLFYGFEGGEPLLRRDLPQILSESHKRFHTSLVTNGWLLKERISEISESVESIFVSLDGIGPLHDKLRGIVGSFDRAVQGIKSARDKVSLLAINCTITRSNIDQIGEMLRLAEELEVKINFQPAYDYSKAGKLSPYGEKLEATLLSLLEAKRNGGPLLNSRESLTLIVNSWFHGIPWRCKPWLTINIDPQGRIVLPCYTLQEYNGDPGNEKFAYYARDTDIPRLWDSYNWEEYEGCNKCALSCYLETSVFSWTKPAVLKDRIVDSILSYSGIGV